MKFFSKPLGCLFTLLATVVVLVVIAGVVGVFLLNRFAAEVVGHQVELRTGFPVVLGPQHVSVLDGAVDFQDLKILNPDRFPSKDFLTFNQLQAKVDVWSLAGERIVVEEAVLDVGSVTVVQPKDGKSNVTDFTSGLIGETKEPAPGAEPPPPAAESKPRAYLIRKLTIKIGTVQYVNFSSGTPKTLSHTLNYSRTFTDVTNVNDLWPLLAKDFAAAGVSFLAQALVSSLLDSETYKNIGNTLLNTPGQAVDGVKGVADGVGNALQNLFK